MTTLLIVLIMTLFSSSALAQNLNKPLDPSNPDRPATSTTKPTPQVKPAPIDTTTSDQVSFIALLGQRLVSYLSNLRSALERTTSVSDTEKTTILAALNQDISVIQTAAITLSNSHTSDELNKRIASLQSFWQDKENTITYYLGLVVGNGFQHAIDRFRSIEASYTLLFDRFKPTSDLITLKKQFSDALNAANTSYMQAKDIFTQIKTPGDHKDLLAKGVQAFRDAHTHLKQARTLSRQLLSELHQALDTTTSVQTSTPSIQP